MKNLSALAALPLIFVLSGCGLLFGQTQDDVKTLEKEEPAVVDEVLAAVQPLTGEDGVPSSRDLFAAMEDAGYDKDALEATIDRSPLDHDVPSKQFAVKVDEGCVIGEIRDGQATAGLYPVSKSMGNCLYGDVDRPKGAKDPTGTKIDKDDDDNGAGHLPGEDLNNRTDGKEAPTSEAVESADSDTGSAGLGGN